MTEPFDALQKVFRKHDIQPASWAEVLDRIESKLDAESLSSFRKLHRNFVEYASSGTLKRFYGFLFDHSLQYDVLGYRAQRLTSLWPLMRSNLRQGGRFLDVGAGCGIISEAIRIEFEPEMMVFSELVPQAVVHLKRLGLTPIEELPGVDFDTVLCVDSLGELHCDEDDALSRLVSADIAVAGRILEERYGFLSKLEELLPTVRPGGTILIFEPFENQDIWSALSHSLAEKHLHSDPLLREGHVFGLSISGSHCD